MAARGIGSIKARVIRLTRLDECGRPVTGACSVIVTDGFTRVNAAAEYEDGEEFTVKNAWGDLCINEKDPDRLKRMNLGIDFCAVHPDIADLVAGAVPLLDGTQTPVGFAVTEDIATSKFMLELWAGTTGGDACAPSQGGQPTAKPWHYWLFPQVDVGRIGDLTWEYGPLTWSIEASTKVIGSNWSFPHSPSPLPGQVPDGSHYVYALTTVPPPASTDGCVAYPVPVPPVAATGATAGAPGAFTPTGATVPATLAALQAAAPPVVASPATAWATGESVLLGDASEAHWNGTAWAAGKA